MVLKIIGLDGRSNPFPPTGHMPKEDDSRRRSRLHLRARSILRQLFPSDRVLEEVPLPGSFGLFADFYLPRQKIVVECNGRQHYKFNAHFHGTKMNFLKSRANDSRKKEWCQQNEIRFVELPFDEEDDEWTRRIEEG